MHKQVHACIKHCRLGQAKKEHQGNQYLASSAAIVSLQKFGKTEWQWVTEQRTCLILAPNPHALVSLITPSHTISYHVYGEVVSIGQKAISKMSCLNCHYSCKLGRDQAVENGCLWLAYPVCKILLGRKCISSTHSLAGKGLRSRQDFQNMLAVNKWMIFILHIKNENLPRKNMHVHRTGVAEKEAYSFTHTP